MPAWISATMSPVRSLPAAAMHHYRSGADVLGEDIDRPHELQAAAVDHVGVEIGHVRGAVEPGRVVDVDHPVHDRDVMGGHSVDEPGTAVELALLTEIDHRLQTQPLDSSSAGIGQADGVVGAVEHPCRHPLPVGGGPATGVTDVEASLDVDVECLFPVPHVRIAGSKQPCNAWSTSARSAAASSTTAAASTAATPTWRPPCITRTRRTTTDRSKGSASISPPTRSARLRDGFDATQHTIGDSVIEFADDDTAYVETYVCARQRRHDETGQFLETFGGRYVDRFERRGGEWKIADRVVVHEWDKVERVELAFPAGRFTEGRRSRDDVSYRRR